MMGAKANETITILERTAWILIHIHVSKPALTRGVLQGSILGCFLLDYFNL